MDVMRVRQIERDNCVLVPATITLTNCNGLEARWNLRFLVMMDSGITHAYVTATLQISYTDSFETSHSCAQ